MKSQWTKRKLRKTHLNRQAVVYVRQSTFKQETSNAAEAGSLSKGTRQTNKNSTESDQQSSGLALAKKKE
jgi:hypothetical protein